MTVLVDTHVILWWWSEPTRLSEAAGGLLESPETVVLVSPVSAYEILWKNQLGKLELPDSITGDFADCIREERWRILDVTLRHASVAGTLSWDHRDPFDRLLAAQAIDESVTLMTCDPAIAALPELKTIW
ncbi:MAG: type II toxin-antitoxin system VapC family toxin [Planctomycetota bacterium]